MKIEDIERELEKAEKNAAELKEKWMKAELKVRELDDLLEEMESTQKKEPMTQEKYESLEEEMFKLEWGE